MIAKIFFRWLQKSKLSRSVETVKARGYMRSSLDDRDRLYGFDLEDESTIIPTSHVINHDWDVKDQGRLSSCVSHSLASIAEYLQTKDSRSHNDAVVLSELFHYYVARQNGYSSNFPADTGLYPREALKAAQKVGFAPEVLWSYREADVNTKPALAAFWMASLFKIRNYSRLYSLSSIKSLVLHDNPCMLCFDVTRAFERNRALDFTPDGGVELGGHAVTVVGYDDERACLDGSKGAFLILNSWGTGWGASGLSWIPYSYVNQKWYESWAINAW